jgi:hypothetical protein
MSAAGTIPNARTPYHFAGFFLRAGGGWGRSRCLGSAISEAERGWNGGYHARSVFQHAPMVKLAILFCRTPRS